VRRNTWPAGSPAPSSAKLVDTAVDTAEVARVRDIGEAIKATIVDDSNYDKATDVEWQWLGGSGSGGPGLGVSLRSF
jgi:hypothetical protein